MARKHLLYGRVRYPTARNSCRASVKVFTTFYTNLLSAAQGNYTEAEPLYQQALAIYDKTLGPEHPHVLDILAGSLQRQVRNSVVRGISSKAAGQCSRLGRMRLAEKTCFTLNIYYFFDLERT